MRSSSRGVGRSLVAEERASSATASSRRSRRSRSRSRGRALPLDVARPLTRARRAAPSRRLRRRRAGRRERPRGDRRLRRGVGEAGGVVGRHERRPARRAVAGSRARTSTPSPVTVYDIAESSLVSPRLATLVGAQSGAWVPMITEERVVGVLVLATTDEKRDVRAEELSVLQAVAAEAAIAFERLRSAAALAEALERERRAAEIVRRLRAELDPDDVVRVAREELADDPRARLDHDRCRRRRGDRSTSARRPADGRRAGARRDGPLRDRRRGSHRGAARRAARARRACSAASTASRRCSVSRVSPAEAYDAAAQAAAEALGGDFAAVLARGAGGLVRRRRARAAGPRCASCPIPQALADAAEDGQMLAATDARARRPLRRRLASTRRSRSLLAIPVRGEQAELVLVFFDEAHAFSRRRPRARAAGRRRRARRARAQPPLRGRAHGALPVAAARPNGQPARDRARPRRGARRRRRARRWSCCAPTPPRSRRSTSATS